MSEVFGQFARREVEPDAEPETVSQEDEREYQAYRTRSTARPETRLLVYFENGYTALFSYAYLMRVLCTSHQFVSLIYSDGALTLRGRNLYSLLARLQDDRVRSLHCFIAGFHHEIAPDQPVIQAIKWESLHEAMGRKPSKKTEETA